MENRFNDPAIPWKGISELIENAGCSQNKRDFLERMLEGIGTLIPYDVGGGLLRHDGQYIASYGHDRKTIEDYNRYYVNTMFFLPQSMNEAFRDGSRYDLLPVLWDAYSESEFVADFCRPLHLGMTLTYFPPRIGLSFALHRGERAMLFDDTEKTTLRILNAHMNNYIKLFEQLELAAPQVLNPKEISRRFPKLSKRESEVVHQTCLGFSAALIAKRSGVSRRTVESQLLSAYQKLGVNTKKELVLKIADTPSGEPEREISPDSHAFIFLTP